MVTIKKVGRRKMGPAEAKGTLVIMYSTSLEGVAKHIYARCLQNHEIHTPRGKGGNNAKFGSS